MAEYWLTITTDLGSNAGDDSSLTVDKVNVPEKLFSGFSYFRLSFLIHNKPP